MILKEIVVRKFSFVKNFKLELKDELSLIIGKIIVEKHQFL